MQDVEFYLGLLKHQLPDSLSQAVQIKLAALQMTNQQCKNVLYHLFTTKTKILNPDLMVSLLSNYDYSSKNNFYYVLRLDTFSLKEGWNQDPSIVEAYETFLSKILDFEQDIYP